MRCCSTVNGLDRMFNRRRAQREARRYRKKGLDGPTRRLAQALVERGVAGFNVLEIGFGTGQLHLELLKAGADKAVGLELSPAYVETAQDLASKLGLGDAVQYRLQNIAESDTDVSDADIVVMNRVVCCYQEMEKLVHPAAERARRYLALSFPRAVWWMRLAARAANTILALARREFRVYLHDPREVRGAARSRGLTESYRAYAGPWEVVLFERSQS